MKLDELFEKTHRMEAPDSVRRRVMGRIEAEMAGAQETTLFKRVGAMVFGARAALSLAAVAAAAVLAIRITVPAGMEPQKVIDTKVYTEVSEFIGANLGPVYKTNGQAAGVAEDESIDLETYVTNQFQEIFWINGGNNA